VREIFPRVVSTGVLADGTPRHVRQLVPSVSGASFGPRLSNPDLFSCHGDCLVAKSHYPARLRVLGLGPLKAGLLEDRVFAVRRFLERGSADRGWPTRGNFVVKAELRMKMLLAGFCIENSGLPGGHREETLCIVLVSPPVLLPPLG
jgi:hypothetical protein